MIVTIITGASRGIGKAITEGLSDFELILYSRNKVDFEDYSKVYYQVKTDLFGREVEQINLVLCASQIGTANTLGLYEMDRIYRSNVLGNLAVVKAASEYGVPMRIVWLAGGGAAFPLPEFTGYALSKVATVRAVENLSLTLKDTTIVALAPGAVDTDMLKKTIAAGCKIRTYTDVKESVDFVRKFILSDSTKLNGCFLHVRDDIDAVGKDIFKLRRVQ